MLIAKIRRGGVGWIWSVFWRARGVQVADRFSITGRPPKLGGLGKVIIGSRVSFRTIDAPIRFGTGYHGILEIGDRCFFNSGVVLTANHHMRIGEHCKFGENVRLGDYDYHEVDEGSGAGGAPITIGRNVWIATGASILSGVELGDHCVVATGAVVTKSFPARTLIGGNPARVLRIIEASDDYVRS